ncbi:hypothetical protein L3X38_004322 [Prunus dulcis]|uniref:Uncharacterized protein n=1 Tax=Prunus dulcis TaxID=3755 RepID=A0AAD4ZNT8_PRUDU|nr:hypothetical protein L3X38_004322 [Prunus dulcis]
MQEAETALWSLSDARLPPGGAKHLKGVPLKFCHFLIIRQFPWQVSVTQSQPKPQTSRIQGTVVSLIRIPGSHGPSVPETREANVKRADKTEGNLDVGGHRHIRRQLVSTTGYLRWLKKI